MRADQLLVLQGLAPTRSAAQRLIERGAVLFSHVLGDRLPPSATAQRPELANVFSTFTTAVPRMHIELDRDRAREAVRTFVSERVKMVLELPSAAALRFTPAGGAGTAVLVQLTRGRAASLAQR